MTNTDDQQSALRLPPARRVVLRAGAVLPIGVGIPTLAGCGSDEAAVEPSASESSAEESGDQTGESAEGSEASQGAEGFPAADVPVGGATYDEPSNTVFSQPSEGEFRAFDATCPHQGCSVSEFADGDLRCPCHGSTFDLDSGDVTGGPATTGLTAREVSLDGDDLVVS